MAKPSLNDTDRAKALITLGLQFTCWFVALQACTFMALGNLYVSDLGWGAVAIPVWAPIGHLLISWLIFRSRFSRFSPPVAWSRLGANFIYFAAIPFGVHALFELSGPTSFEVLSSQLNPLLTAIAPYREDSAFVILLEFLWGVVGSLITGLIFFGRPVRLMILTIVGATMAVFTVGIGINKAVGTVRNWRASPDAKEYAVYEAIARRNAKRYGIKTQVVRECSIEFIDVSGEYIRALGAEGAFLDYQKRQRQGCRMQRAFEAESQLELFPNRAMSPKLLGPYTEAHQEPMLIEIFSRVGFSPDGARAYLSRISLVQWHDREHGRQATISKFGTTLTKADGSWEVDYGFEYDEWAALSAKRTEAERKASIHAVRTLRGLWAAP